MNDAIEYAVVGDLLSDGFLQSDLKGLVDRYRLQAGYFRNNSMRTAFEMVLERGRDDLIALRHDVVGRIGVEEVEKAIANSDIDLISTENHVRQLAKDGVLSAATGIFNDVMLRYRNKASAEFILSDIQTGLAGLAQSMGGEINDDGGISMDSLRDQGPEDEHPDALLKNGYLRKGHALLLASVTGSGKSVISIQMAYAFAAGRPFMGITPLRPMKIGIFETEDDDVELVEFRSSMRRGYREVHGWSDEDLAAAEKNIVFMPVGGRTGDTFVDWLKSVQLRRHFDLVIINPLQAVCGCNLSDNTEIRHFTKERLDPVIKGEATKCALLIIHHTNKPVMAAGRPGFGGDEYAEYLGAGAGEIANWMRAMLAVMPDRESGGYRFIAAKRGPRLNWPEISGRCFTKPTRLIRHSTREEHMLFWREIDSNAVPDVVEKDEGPSVVKDAAQLAVALKNLARTLTEARAFAKELFGRKRGEAAYEEITSKAKEYDLEIRPLGINNQTLVGSVESVEKRFSTEVEKHAQKQLSKLQKMSRKS